MGIRPSGTELKLKFYIAVKDEDETQANEKLSKIKEEIDIIINKLI